MTQLLITDEGKPGMCIFHMPKEITPEEMYALVQKHPDRFRWISFEENTEEEARELIRLLG